MKVTLFKDYQHPNGKLFPAGSVMKVTIEFAQQLEAEGYLTRKEKEAKPKPRKRPTTTQKAK